jgi:hypothetical protein
MIRRKTNAYRLPAFFHAFFREAAPWRRREHAVNFGMGYIFTLVVALAVLVVVFVALTRGRSRPVGKAPPRTDISYRKPSSDEPTPGRSSTASNETAETARRHTPPS